MGLHHPFSHACHGEIDIKSLKLSGLRVRSQGNSVMLSTWQNRTNKQTKLNQPTNHQQQNQEESVENRPAGDALRKEGK